MSAPRRTDQTLDRRYSSRYGLIVQLTVGGVVLAAVAALLAASGTSDIGGVPARYLVAGMAGVAAMLSIAVAVITVVTSRTLRAQLLDPIDEMGSRLRKMIIAQVTDMKPLSHETAQELRDIWSNYQKLAGAMERAKQHAQAAMDATAARNRTALDAAMQAQAEKEKGETDPLTKLFNRRRMDADLERDAQSIADGSSPPFAFVMVDVDHFKSFNDTYGHQKGDEILQGLAKILKESVRGLDTAYRYGGEEFSIILRHMNAPSAYEVVERIRAKVEAIFAATDTPMTASFGVSLAPHCAMTPANIIAAADEALYQSKESGRNRVTLAPPSPGGVRPGPAPPPPPPSAPAPHPEERPPLVAADGS